VNGKRVRWLLVFDDVDDISKIDAYWPSSQQHGAFIVTSKNGNIATDSRIHHCLNIDSLPGYESIQLLRASHWQWYKNLEAVEKSSNKEVAEFLADDKKNREFFEQMAHLMHGHPEMLETVTEVYTKAQGEAVEDFLAVRRLIEQKDDTEERLEQLRLSPVGLVWREQGEHWIGENWHHETLTRNALMLLDILCTICIGRAPEQAFCSKLITDAGRQDVADIRSQMWEKHYWKYCEESYEDTRDELVRRSLITRDIENRELVVPDVVKEVIQYVKAKKPSWLEPGARKETRRGIPLWLL
jgi:hypothetical protein